MRPRDAGAYVAPSTRGHKHWHELVAVGVTDVNFSLRPIGARPRMQDPPRFRGVRAGGAHTPARRRYIRWTRLVLL